MTKARDSRKAEKKQPAKTPKEKKAAKKDKKKLPGTQAGRVV
jgi:hypothetical protein